MQRLMGVFVLAFLGACSAPPPKVEQPPKIRSTLKQVTVGCPNGNVTCELASTFETRAIGLAGRSVVPPLTGMLFTYADVDARGFWMKGCLVPLDIAYVRDDGTVVNVARMEAPVQGTPDDQLPRLPSAEPVRLVFEVAAGEAARLGVVPGAKLRLPPGIALEFPVSDP